MVLGKTMCRILGKITRRAIFFSTYYILICMFFPKLFNKIDEQNNKISYLLLISRNFIYIYNLKF